MKVAVYLDEYQPRDGGGYTMQSELFRAFCRAYKRSQHEFYVISTPNPAVQAETEAAGLTWLADNRASPYERAGDFLARKSPKFRNRFHWRNSLEKKARRTGVNFIWFLGPRPRVIDLPYLTIVLDLQHRKQPWFPEVSEFGEWETRERLLAPFLQRAAGIITGTQAGKKEITDFFQVPEDRIHILPHPTPEFIEDGSAKGNQSVTLPFSSPFLFYPAQFWAHKNHINLLLAVKALADGGLKIPVVLTGSDFGNQAFVEAQISALGLSEQVKILGFVNQAKMVSLYKNALALTYVSFFGPENLPPLEAFALGCPVIAANADGAEEQMGNAALLVDPSSPEDIAQAIRRVYEDEQFRNELLTRGKVQAEQRTTENFILGVFKVLDDFESIRRIWSSS